MSYVVTQIYSDPNLDGSPPHVCGTFKTTEAAFAYSKTWAEYYASDDDNRELEIMSDLLSITVTVQAEDANGDETYVYWHVVAIINV